jgi:hypothetical protein
MDDKPTPREHLNNLTCRLPPRTPSTGRGIAPAAGWNASWPKAKMAAGRQSLCRVLHANGHFPSRGPGEAALSAGARGGPCRSERCRRVSNPRGGAAGVPPCNRSSPGRGR